MRRLILATVLALLLLPAVARADGDPASDILTQRDVYYGIDLNLRSKPAAQLPALLDGARRKGYEIKVATIAEFDDLGVVGFLWKQPADYARYLGEELSIGYKQRTLVVMPNGYGIYHFGHSGVREQRLLDKLPPPRRAANFLPGAIDAVRRLAAASGTKLSVPDVDPPAGGVKQPESHFAVGQQGGTIPPPPAATARAPVAAVKTGDGGGGLLFLAVPALIAVVMAGSLLARKFRRKPVGTSAEDTSNA
jgi:hypothetical protein